MRSCLLLLLAALCAPACSDETVSGKTDGGLSCPACGAGEACDPATGQCTTGLSEGALCGGAPDGGAIGGVCAEGLSCGSVGNAARCSVDCTAQTAARVCGAARQCFARPGTPTEGFCATPAAEGQACDEALLAKCSGTRLSCILAGDAPGTCFRTCDPTAAAPDADCAAGTTCSDVFASDRSFGICVVPAGRYPATCDASRYSFCARGELCVRPSDESWGYCHRRCAGPEDCPAGEACAEPSVGLQICVAPVARCAGADAAACPACSATLDAYCGPGDLCVRLGESTVCKQECTGGVSCAAGTCTPLPEQQTARSVCLE